MGKVIQFFRQGDKVRLLPNNNGIFIVTLAKIVSYDGGNQSYVCEDEFGIFPCPQEDIRLVKRAS